MRNFLSILGTVFQEPRVLAEAWKKQVNLPPNYWRTQLAMFVLVCSSKNELPRALRYNYCPLFWFTNILVLLLPAILLIAGVMKLAILIARTLGTFAITPGTEYIESWCADRKAVRETVKVEKKKRRLLAVKYDDRSPDFELLSDGQDRFEAAIQYKLPENFSFNDPVIVEIIASDWVANRAVMYYLSFRQIFSTNHETKLRELREAWRAKEQENTKKQLEEIKRKEAVDADWNKIFSSIFYWSKIICKALLFIVSVPLIALLAWGIYVALIFLAKGVVWLGAALFVTHLKVTLLCIGIAIAFAVVIFGIVIFVQSGALREKVWEPFIDFLENRVAPFFGVLFKPFAFAGKKIAGFFTFLTNFIRMFYSENCPGITYTDEVPSGK